MTIVSRPLSLLAFALLCATPLPAAGISPQESSSAVEYAFREPPANSMGIGSLADLRGKPILIEFWGTR